MPLVLEVEPWHFFLQCPPEVEDEPEVEVDDEPEVEDEPEVDVLPVVLEVLPVELPLDVLVLLPDELELEELLDELELELLLEPELLPDDEPLELPEELLELPVLPVEPVDEPWHLYLQ